MSLQRRMLRISWVVHRLLDRLSGGRFDTGRIGQPPSLWLTTIGRHSGEPRTTGLYYLQDGPRLVVVASNAGGDRDPGWWLNLQANSDAVVRIGRTSRRVRARRASPEETARLWPELVRTFPPYADYARQTSRTIPVVVLEPR